MDLILGKDSTLSFHTFVPLSLLVRPLLGDLYFTLLILCWRVVVGRIAMPRIIAHPNVKPILPMFPMLLDTSGAPIAPVGNVGKSVFEKSKPAAQS